MRHAVGCWQYHAGHFNMRDATWQGICRPQRLRVCPASAVMEMPPQGAAPAIGFTHDHICTTASECQRCPLLGAVRCAGGMLQAGGRSSAFPLLCHSESTFPPSSVEVQLG